MSEPVIISAYDPDWVHQFAALRDRVVAALGDVALAVEHIGSTAVPGLAAKPIIDINVVVGSVDDVPAAIVRLATIGYVHRGDQGIPGREAFAQPPGPIRHHLYVVAVDGMEHRRHVMFRDYLRTHPEAAAAYEALKRELADRHRDDRVAYTDGKGAFVAEMLRRAAEEGCPTA